MDRLGVKSSSWADHCLHCRCYFVVNTTRFSIALARFAINPGSGRCGRITRCPATLVRPNCLFSPDLKF